MSKKIIASVVGGLIAAVLIALVYVYVPVGEKKVEVCFGESLKQC